MAPTLPGVGGVGGRAEAPQSSETRSHPLSAVQGRWHLTEDSAWRCVVVFNPLAMTLTYPTSSSAAVASSTVIPMTSGAFQQDQEWPSWRRLGC
jgi:hypothetical protein